MSRARGTMSPDLGAPAADIILSAVSSRLAEEEVEGGRRRAIRLIAAIVEEEEVVVWWVGGWGLTDEDVILVLSLTSL